MQLTLMASGGSLAGLLFPQLFPQAALGGGPMLSPMGGMPAGGPGIVVAGPTASGQLPAPPLTGVRLATTAPEASGQVAVG